MKDIVTTWADGFGVWHARVTFTEPPEDKLHTTLRRVRDKARHTMRAEMAQRDNIGPEWKLYILQTERSSKDGIGTIVFKEKVA